MSKYDPPQTGLWIPAERVGDYQERGYVVTAPQPKVNDEKKKLHAGSIHMTRKTDVEL